MARTLTQAVAADLAADLYNKSAHMAHINEGDWSAVAEAAEELDKAIMRATGNEVAVADDVEAMAELVDLL